MSETSERESSGELGGAATWAMAAGGMVGGGIFSALGVVVAVAGTWSWLSFVLAGAVALCAAFSYGRLSNDFGEEGGAFVFLRELDREGVAGSLSWVLMIGYVLTMSVYAFTFGHYVAYALDMGPWVTRLTAIGLVTGLALLNLAGITEAKAAEIGIVVANLVILGGLAVTGLLDWNAQQLGQGVPNSGVWGGVMGAGAIFMAYEGFQLLSYDYKEIENPHNILTPAIMGAVLFVIGVYVSVALGTVMLIGAGAVESEGAVALAVAAQSKFGTAGLVVMTIGAACATGAAINSTLFSTARLMRRVADDAELPAWFDYRGSENVPSRAIVALGAMSAVLAAVGSLSMLVEAASVAFLFTFGAVNVIAIRELDEHRWVPALGVVLTLITGGGVLWYLLRHEPVALAILVGLILLAVFGRPKLLERVDTEGEPAGTPG